MVRLGLPIEPITESGPDAIEHAADYVARRVRDGVTAWMCASDHAGYQLYQKLEKRGLRIPQDVSLTGFDGSPGVDGNAPAHNASRSFPGDGGCSH